MARILVVDDEPDIRQVIRIILEADGHEIVEAEDGLSAFEVARQGGIDLVLLDAMMPGMDGYQLLEKFLDLPDFEAPVVMVTGRSDAEGMMAEADSGAIDHIAKPFSMEEVRRTVERMLSLSPGDRDARRQMLTRSAVVYGAMTELRSLVSGPEDDDKPRRRFGS
jgi:DNA-binding response OmpR family regulator